MTHRILLCLAVAALAACDVMPVAQAPGAFEVDQARMAAIERAAALNGVKVLWINAPRKNAAGG